MGLTIADWLTLSRILIIVPITWAFWEDRVVLALVLFLLGGATDIVDGYLARRRGSSRLGPELDGIADFFFGSAIYVWVFWKAPFARPAMLFYAIIGVPLMIAYFVVSYRRTGRLLMIHLVSGKLIGCSALVSVPMLLYIHPSMFYVHLTLSIYLFYYVECLVFVLRGRTDTNSRSAFF